MGRLSRWRRKVVKNHIALLKSGTVDGSHRAIEFIEQSSNEVALQMIQQVNVCVWVTEWVQHSRQWEQGGKVAKQLLNRLLDLFFKYHNQPPIYFVCAIQHVVRSCRFTSSL
jgi:hypothetical protein